MYRLALILAVLSFCPALFAGVIYSATTRSQTGDAIAITKVRGYIQGPNARLEFLEGSSVSPGTYILTSDNGATFIQVDPAHKSFVSWTSPQSGSLPKRPESQPTTSVSEPKFEKLLDEEGGLILGMKTRHVRYRTSYTFTITFRTPQTTQMISEDDLWITQEVKDPSLKNWLGGEAMNQTDPLMRTEMSKINGIPLKRVTALTSIEEDGLSETTHTEMNVTELKQQTIPAAKFTVPPGYKEKVLPVEPRGRNANRDDVN